MADVSIPFQSRHPKSVEGTILIAEQYETIEKVNDKIKRIETQPVEHYQQRTSVLPHRYMDVDLVVQQAASFI